MAVSSLVGWDSGGRPAVYSHIIELWQSISIGLFVSNSNLVL